jgi:eukaryotic-like serine/threonine-protein kinase
MATTAMLVSFAGWGAWQILAETEWIKGLNPTTRPLPVQTGLLRVLSAPDGAEVTDARGNLLGVTNGVQISVTVGDDYFFTMKRTGYRTLTLQGKVPATVVTEPLALFASLENFTPPQIGEKWNDHLGNPYQPAGDTHVSSGFVNSLVWDEFTERGNHSSTAVEFFKFSQNGRPVQLALTTETEAQAFCKWFQAGGLNAGFLTDDHEVVPVMETTFENPGLSERTLRDGLRPFRVMVRLINYGEITLTTNPPGVEVWMNALNDPTNRVSVGSTRQPLVIPNLKPAEWQLYLVCEGYKPLTMDIKVGEGEKISKQVALEKSLGVVFGKPWENSAGMRFVPLGQDLMVSIWETRVRDYQSFMSDIGPEKHRAAFFPQSQDEPVVNVSRRDGQEFCKWLTEKEREDERIAQTHLYRLPTDLEWSRMVELDEQEGLSPNWRDARKQVLYPWGTAWPPIPQSGNFADMTAARTPGVSIDRTIWDYDDGFAFTAPVGSFPPNPLGIYDLSGNVQEWVEDEFSKLGDNPLGVLRGGGWNSYQSENLYSGSRNAAPPTYQDAIYGFRVVLAKFPLDGE